MMGGLNIGEAGHSSEADAVLDNPKQFLVGIAPYLLAREIGCAWVHPSDRRILGSGFYFSDFKTGKP